MDNKRKKIAEDLLDGWGWMYHLEVTEHVCGKFTTGYYQVWHSYLYPNVQAVLEIESYANYKDQSSQEVTTYT